MGALRLRGILAALALLIASPLAAQDAQGQIRSPILIIEADRLFTESAFGQRVAEEIEAAGAALRDENMRIEAALIEEEQALTEQRATLPAAEFRALADAFDEKVQRIRREQDAKANAIAERGEEDRRVFLNAAQPALGALMREANAAIILERRQVFLSADVLDVTDEAIARIDAAIGSGLGVIDTAPAPESDTAPDAPETDRGSPSDNFPGAPDAASGGVDDP